MITNPPLNTHLLKPMLEAYSDACCVRTIVSATGFLKICTAWQWQRWDKPCQQQQQAVKQVGCSATDANTNAAGLPPLERLCSILLNILLTLC